MFWVDVFGTFIRVDITKVGSKHDRGIFNESGPFRNEDEYFDGEQHAIGDIGFQGAGKVLCPFKSNQGATFVHRGMWNKELRRERICNEWGIGYINNRNRLFLGRWPFESCLFPVNYENAAMIANWRWRRRGTTLVPLERRLSRLSRIENDCI